MVCRAPQNESLVDDSAVTFGAANYPVLVCWEMIVSCPKERACSLNEGRVDLVVVPFEAEAEAERVQIHYGLLNHYLLGQRWGMWLWKDLYK